MGLLDWKAIGFAALAWLVNVLVAYKKGPSRELTRIQLALRKSLVPTLIIWVLAILFVALLYSPWQRYNALKEYAQKLKETTPQVVHQDKPETLKELQLQKEQTKQQNDQIRSLTQELKEKDGRITDLVQKLPPPEIDRQKREKLVEALKRIDGPRRILIKYLNVSSSRASIFARHLADIFESASWHVRLFNTKKGEVIDRGFAIRHEDGSTKIPPVIKAIHDAFSNAGVPLGSIIRGQNPVEQIELEVGEM